MTSYDPRATVGVKLVIGIVVLLVVGALAAGIAADVQRADAPTTTTTTREFAPLFPAPTPIPADLVNPPQVGDHVDWAYGIYVCDGFVPPMTALPPGPSGITTTDDGVIHVTPELPFTGRAANLERFLTEAGVDVGASGISYQHLRGRPATFLGCAGVPSEVTLTVWDVDRPAEPPRRFTHLDDVVFSTPRHAITIALAPPGASIPRPPSIGALDEVEPADHGPAAGADPQDSDDPGASDEVDPAGRSDTRSTVPSPMANRMLAALDGITTPGRTLSASIVPSEVLTPPSGGSGSDRAERILIQVSVQDGTSECLKIWLVATDQDDEAGALASLDERRDSSDGQAPESWSPPIGPVPPGSFITTDRFCAGSLRISFATGRFTSTVAGPASTEAEVRVLVDLVAAVEATLVPLQ